MFLKFLATAGRLTLFIFSAVSHCVLPPFYPRIIGRYMVEIGYYSLPVVGLTSIFAGMVLALQSYAGFARFSAEGAIANVVVLSITRELGPVLAGLMVAGWIGAAMAAEIDRFNMIKHEESDRVGVRFINITTIFRRAGGDPILVADDNLHPSGKVHTPWADTNVPLVKSALLKEETP